MRFFFAYDSFISFPVWHPTWGTCILYHLFIESLRFLDLENFCINNFLNEPALFVDDLRSSLG